MVKNACNICVFYGVKLPLYSTYRRVYKNAFIIKYVTMLKKNSFVCLLFKIIGLSLCVNFAPRNGVIYYTVSADVVICG